MLNVKQIFQ